MKNILPIIVVLAILGVIAFAIMNRKESDTVETNGTSTDLSSEESESSVPDTFTGTLMDAIKLGVGMKCTYEVEGNEYEGYIKGEQYKGKMKTTEGKEAEVIVKDNCMWTWAENETQGMKICFEESETESTNIWDQPQGAMGTDMNYKCLPAAITDAQFDPPSNIEFINPMDSVNLDMMEENSEDL